MLREKGNISKLNFKNINFIIYHPTILKKILQRKTKAELRAEARRLNKQKAERLAYEESLKFISSLKKTLPYQISPNYKLNLNKLCYIEDWENNEIRNAISDLHLSPEIINRKDWEWALGLIAMKRLGKLNQNSKAIGVATAHEVILFYLANKLNHVYATDLYEPQYTYTPTDFPENPRKYAPFSYKEDKLTALRMDATHLNFPSETFDIAFSFSSIEHFGGDNHYGALKGLKEIERVLKPEGIAVITTEYIINDKNHPEFFNKSTIYSDLINKLDSLKLVEPLDLRLTTKTLDTVMDLPDAEKWKSMNDEFKKIHYPPIILRINGILFTSVMLVFKKE